jgi:hypothetical protein
MRLYLGRRFWLTPGVNFSYAQAGDIQFNGDAGIRDWRHRQVDLMIGIKFDETRPRQASCQRRDQRPTTCGETAPSDGLHNKVRLVGATRNPRLTRMTDGQAAGISSNARE